MMMMMIMMMRFERPRNDDNDVNDNERLESKRIFLVMMTHGYFDFDDDDGE